MILDRLDRIGLYEGLGKHFPAAAAYLARADLNNLPVGRF